jgi:hypothetical protein
VSSSPPKWTTVELEDAAETSAGNFRAERLSVTDDWSKHYKASKAKFEELFSTIADVAPSEINESKLSKVYAESMGEAMRYLAGPPISDDDLKVIADVSSLAPTVLSGNSADLNKVFSVIQKVIDPYRFPWVAENRAPTKPEREAALMASSVLLAAQRIATERRSEGKNTQEGALKTYLQSLGFKEVPASTITTIVKGPQEGEFCSECYLGNRKADVVVRLHDTRLMPIECKVSNSSTNSVKRLNNDAAVKAGDWIKKFGALQVVPAALLAGVFNVLNLEQAQDAGLTIFWSHDLQPIGDFIESTRGI